MAVTIEDIKKLRHLTSAGLSDCKAALTETNGDMDAAVEILRQKVRPSPPSAKTVRLRKAASSQMSRTTSQLSSLSIARPTS